MEQNNPKHKQEDDISQKLDWAKVKDESYLNGTISDKDEAPIFKINSISNL